MRSPKKHLRFGSLIQAFRQHCASLQDKRQNGKIGYRLVDVILSGFACLFFQDPSLLQFQKRMSEEKQRSNLTTLFAVEQIPENTQLREVLDDVKSESFRPVFKEYFARLQRGKQLEPFAFLTVDGQKLYLVSIDGTQYFSSKRISCGQCLHREHKAGEKTYAHHALQGALMHPQRRQVVPLMAEDIRNADGQTKQDCEINAAKRFLPALRSDHPQLGMIIVGDSLFSKHPLVELTRDNNMHFIFVAKPGDHQYMMQTIAARQEEVQELRMPQQDGKLFVYHWLNGVPLGAREDAFRVNYFELEIYAPDKNGQLHRTYRCTWVTDLAVQKTTIAHLVQGARCRWKVENECFNTLKNQGYHLAHNFGHGAQFLSFNLYLLTLLAFLCHQIFELTDALYQTARERWAKRLLWETLRSAIKFILFVSWEQLLSHCLDPPDMHSSAPA